MGILEDSFQQTLFKNEVFKREDLRVREARNWVAGLPITNADNLSILGWKVNIYFWADPK
jgi:hypothetical protein